MTNHFTKFYATKITNLSIKQRENIEIIEIIESIDYAKLVKT
jgi:hypothetical protein